MAKDKSILDKLKAITDKFSAPKAVEGEELIVEPGAPVEEPVMEESVSRAEFDSLLKLVEELISKMSPLDAPTVEEAVAAKLDSYMAALKTEAEMPIATATGAPAEEEDEEKAPDGGYLNARQKEIQSKFN